MSFFKSIETLFHKMNEWNETQKELARQRQTPLNQKFEEQKQLAKQKQEALEQQYELLKQQRKEISQRCKEENKEAKQDFIKTATLGLIKPHNASSKNLTTQNNGLEVKMFTVFPDSTNQTPSPFEEMYYANHEEYGILEKEYTRFSARFQSKQCPYCQNVIEKLSTRSRVCPHCKKRFYVKQNFHSEEYMLLSEDEWKPLQQERLFFDWDAYTAEAEFHLKRRDFGLYSSAKYHLLETGYALHKFSPYGMLVKCFELYYLDFSGPNNVHDISPSICPAFKQYAFIAPALLGWIEVAVEEYPQTLEQYEQIFLTEMEKVRLPEQKTLPKTAWNKLKKEIKKYLEYSDEEGID